MTSRVPRGRLAMGLAWMLLWTAACASTAPPPPPPPAPRVAVPMPIVVAAGDLVQVGYFHDHKASSGPYRIAPADVLRVNVAGYPDLNRDDVLVLPDGQISLNLIGPLPAAGKTVDELAADIASRYAARQIRRPVVAVAVLMGQQRVRLFLQSLGRDQGVSNRIEVRVHDHGYLDLPFISPVMVGRPLEEVRRDIKEAYAREFGAALQVTVNLAARPPALLYVMGEVKKPGGVEAQSGQPQTLVSAIAAAGGFADTARPSEVLVLRPNEGGGFEHWRFDLTEEAMTAGRPGDFMLQRGDVVYVGKSIIAKVNLFVEQFIRNNIPFNLSFGAFVPLP